MGADRRAGGRIGSRAVRPFLVWVDGHERHAEPVYARTRGAAKYRKWLDVSDAWTDLPITKMRCRAIRETPPPTPPELERVARYRGFPWVRAGQRIRLGDDRGTIVGGGSGALWEVLFDEGGRWSGGTGYVHPHEISLVYLDEHDEPMRSL
jgi:hypothetical protein